MSNHRIPIRYMIQFAAWHCGITVQEIRSPCRKRRFCVARNAVSLVASELGYHLHITARALNRGDHSTICNARDRARYTYPRDPGFAALVDGLRGLAGCYEARGQIAWTEALREHGGPDLAMVPEEEPEPEVERTHVDTEDADAFAPFPLPAASFLEDMRLGSSALIAAIRREFPGRCAA